MDTASARCASLPGFDSHDMQMLLLSSKKVVGAFSMRTGHSKTVWYQRLGSRKNCSKKKKLYLAVLPTVEKGLNSCLCPRVFINPNTQTGPLNLWHRIWNSSKPKNVDHNRDKIPPVNQTGLGLFLPCIKCNKNSCPNLAKSSCYLGPG